MEDKIIIKRLVVGSLSANCYIMGAEGAGEGMVIDPGGHAEEINRAITDSGLEIKIIVLTHGHSDHIAALRDIQDRTGAEVVIHHEDADFLETSSQFGISYRTPHPPDRLLHEGDTINIGGMSFTVMHTPGHTPGSICLLSGRHLIAGDTLFPGGPGHTNRPDELRQEIRSIVDRLFVLPDDTVVYPGHGPNTTIGESKKEYAVFASREHPAGLCGDVTWT